MPDTTRTVCRRGVMLVDGRGLLVRFPQVGPDGAATCDRVILPREAWEMVDPRERYEGTMDPTGAWVECYVPPGWAPSDHSVEAGAFSGFGLPIAFPGRLTPAVT